MYAMTDSLAFFVQAVRTIHLDDEATNSVLPLFIYGRDSDSRLPTPVAKPEQVASFCAVPHLHPEVSLDPDPHGTVENLLSSLVLGADGQANACDLLVDKCETPVCRRLHSTSFLAGCFL